MTAAGLIQYLVIAWYFGMGSATDALIVAQGVPLLFTQMGEAVLNYTFLPVFIEHRDRSGLHEARVVSNTLFCICALALAALALVACALAPFIVGVLAPGMSGDTRHLAGRLLMIMAPLIALRFLSAHLSALMNSVNEFMIPALTGLLPVVAGVALLLHGAHRWGIASIAAGYVVGAVLQLVILLVVVHRHGMGIGRPIALNHPGVRQIRKLFGPRMADFSFTGLNLTVDRWFASLLGPGYLSALSFAQRILRFPNALVMGSLGRTMLPVLSHQHSRGDEGRMRLFLSTSIRLLAFVTLPMTFFIIFFREEIIRLLFQRGAFDAHSTEITAYALMFYSFGILGYAIAPVLKVAFFSIQDTMTPLRVSGFLVLANAVLDYLLMQVLGHGGIALSTAIVLSASSVTLWILLERRIGPMEGLQVARSVGRVLAISLAIAVVLRAVSSVSLGPQEASWERLVGTLAPLALGGVLFVAGCVLFRISEFREIRAMVRRRGGRERTGIP